ncbi:hypothetical protein BS47DRAFT_1313604 [Hydnum rufescens UP504]|uniref:Peptidase M48 domain-containing protein n=1 Tax=Hydnum rufescens UP504 TaxID=1448309 RepID=A0A9P6E0I2_9AGAM|nr:hypothetical protein BS47DRAFT_1313604 [Hydnum rufescens UP504]
MRRGLFQCFIRPNLGLGGGERAIIFHPTRRGGFSSVLPSLRLRTGSFPLAPSYSRTFQTSTVRRDVFFVAFPALKTQLLNITRFSLIVLPFVYRYRLHKKYPGVSLALLQIPIFATCIVIGLALDQSPHTHRWRLLLMTHREEIEWARRRFEDFLRTDGPLLLKGDDPRVQQVQRVAERIVSVSEEPDVRNRIVSAAVWPPLDNRLLEANANDSAARLHQEYPPTARVVYDASMPFVLESSNPTKVFESRDWKLYIVDLPRINAFALPTREIVVYTGLIDLLDDDALLSSVIGHEVSHVVQRHAVENAGFLNVATIVFDVLRSISFALTMSFPLISDATASVFNVMNNYLVGRAFSRKLEEEADALGLEFMANAGYDPREALLLWDIMAAVEEDATAAGEATSIPDRIPLLRTHPTSQKRKEHLEKLMPKALELYRNSTLRRLRGVTEPTTESAPRKT